MCVSSDVCVTSCVSSLAAKVLLLVCHHVEEHLSVEAGLVQVGGEASPVVAAMRGEVSGSPS